MSGNIDFFQELDKRCQKVNQFILDPRFTDRFKPDDIQWAATSYVRYGGKRLRPSILLISCGIVGGDEDQALPAAAAVELFHTWTLVHDDIIDRDPKRRGGDTVHEHFRKTAGPTTEGFRLSAEEAHHYGTSIAIMTGDIQHGWGISMMTEMSTQLGVDPEITLYLINELDTKVLNTLVEGEVLDIQFAYRDLESLTPDMIEDMLWRKTGALYEFCGRAGAMIGVGKKQDPKIEAVAQFAALCGTAFQLQDDILGVIGKEKALGKPIGSDLREGKRTLVLYHAFNRASRAEKDKMMSVLGNQSADEKDIVEVTNMLRDLGGIDTVAKRAKLLIEQAHPHLDIFPDSIYKQFLYQWADFMIQREF